MVLFFLIWLCLGFLGVLIVDSIPPKEDTTVGHVLFSFCGPLLLIAATIAAIGKFLHESKFLETVLIKRDHTDD